MLSGKALIDLFSRTLCGNGATGGFRSYALFRNAQIPVVVLKLNRKFRFDGWLESTAS